MLVCFRGDFCRAVSQANLARNHNYLIVKNGEKLKTIKEAAKGKFGCSSVKMKTRFLFPVLSFLLLFALNGEGQGQQLAVINKRDPDDENSKLFVGSADGRNEEFLCNYTRSAGVVFSQNSRRLAVNEHTASSGGDEIRIFKGVQGLKFTEVVYEPKLSDILFADAQRTVGFTDYPDSFGCNCVGWTEDENPKCLLEIRVTKEDKEYVFTRALVIETGVIEAVRGE